MRRTFVTWALAGVFAAFTAPLLFAQDGPSAPSEDAQIPRLVEDLGSDDFRVREAATKALTDLGERARPALEAGMKSDSPAVRFRAEQILERLRGSPREKALGEGGAAGTKAPRGDRPRPRIDGFAPGEVDAEMERLRQEMDRRMKELEDAFRGGRMDFPWGQDWGPFVLGRRRTPQGIQLRVDGGASWAELHEGPRGARIVFTAKDDPTDVTTFAGASIAKILESRPMVREWPGAKDLLERYDAERKAREEASKARPPGPGVPGTVEGRSVQIVQTPEGVRVTISEPGPDGTIVTKTYEGADLDTIRREHPEIGDVVGGFSLRFGMRPLSPPVPPVPPVPGPPGERPLGPLEEDDGAPVLPIPGAAEEVRTGPYGLALGPVDDRLRGHLGLAEGEGTLVLAVRPNSEAAKAGILVDDVILSVGATTVKGADDVGRAIREATDRAALRFQVIRGGTRRTLPEPATAK